jgi:hypothetical protein
MSLLVAIPGFGSPMFEMKCHILRHNISILPDDTKFIVFCYDNSYPPPDLRDNPRIEWVFEKGIIFEFLHRHVPPQRIREGGYARVMLLLDDIRLLSTKPNWQVLHALSAGSKNGAFDIVSPSLTEQKMSYWHFMHHNPAAAPGIAWIQNVCEFFCYLMSPEAYTRYFEFIDPENPWTWGMDFILATHMHLKALRLNDWQMEHVCVHQSYAKNSHRDPRADSERYLEKYGTNWAERHSIPVYAAQVALNHVEAAGGTP